MDIQMPVMDGLEAARKIRGLGEPSRSVLIVALTANAMKSEVEKCLAAGMNGCLCKPVRENEMRTALAAYLSKLLIPPSETRTPGPPPPPSSAEPPVPPVLDSKTTLDNIGGNRALLDKMMRIFVEESDLTAARITEAAGRSDFSSLRAALHKMKSESACVGGMRLAMLAAEERNAGGLKDALAAVDTARRELKQRIEELTAAGSNP
jgi:CheY-like chemotaxis protein